VKLWTIIRKPLSALGTRTRLAAPGFCCIVKSVDCTVDTSWVSVAECTSLAVRPSVDMVEEFEELELNNGHKRAEKGAGLEEAQC
jgi:hypothetical protein